MITLAEAKAHLRVEPDFELEDALIQSLINAAVATLEHDTGRILTARGESLVLDAWADPIKLPWWPVRSLTSVRYIDQDGVEQTISNTVLDSRHFPAQVTLMSSDGWPVVQSGGQAITITAEVGASELPADLKHAALLLVAHFYEHREAVVIGTISTALPVAFEYLVQPHRITRFA